MKMVNLQQIGESIFKKGEPGDGFYILFKGAAKIVGAISDSLVLARFSVMLCRFLSFPVVFCRFLTIIGSNIGLLCLQIRLGRRILAMKRY